MGKSKDAKPEKRKQEELEEDVPEQEEVAVKKSKKNKKAKTAHEEEEAVVVEETVAPKKAKKDKKKEVEEEPEEVEEKPVKQKKSKKSAEAEAEEPEVEVKKEKKEKKSAKKEDSDDETAAIKDHDDSDESSDDDDVGGGPVVAGSGKLVPDVPGRKPVDRTQIEPCRRVFVGNLSFKIEEQGLIDFFADCGSVTSIDWMTDKETGKFYGTAFVEFESAVSAQEALKLNGQDLLGRPVKVEFSRPKKESTGTYSKDGNRGTKPLSEKPDYCNTVFCGGLSQDVTDELVMEFFQGCGTITNIRWVTDKASGEFRGCGFVEFEDDSYIEKAAAKNGSSLQGRRIRVDFAANNKR